MNGVVGFVVALLLYPGIAAGVAAAWVLTLARDGTRSALGVGTRPRLFGAFADTRALFARDSVAPAGLLPLVATMIPVLAVAMPLVALIALPLPGNPLVKAFGLGGDLALEGGLLLAVPSLRLFLGWATPSAFTRQAADRGAHVLAGALLPLTLAIAAIAQQVNSLQIGLGEQSAISPLTNVALLARLLAAVAFACCLPVLARTTAVREGDGAPALVGNELTEASGRDLALFRIAEALQLVAVVAFFAAAFVLPLLATAPAGVRIAAWIVAPILGAAGIGAWEALRGAPPSPKSEQPPLSWWFGVPLLVALFALVAASFAARGF
jgi:formate hydrogenlyase subunit 4